MKILDLTELNPTRADFSYPKELLESFAEPQNLIYRPDPRGNLAARQAVASIYRKKGVEAQADQIFLTASTSEAYGFLLKLLTDPGDQILMPTPSYPLLTYLVDLNDAEPLAYPLRYDGGWRVDFETLSRKITEKTRAVVVIHPNHPTGSAMKPEEWAQLLTICKSRNLALIVDEVFAEYLWEGSIFPASFAGEIEVLTFALGGLSKFMGLPQMKLAWILSTGPPGKLSAALKRLEFISDTYLSVAAPVQQAFPSWLRFAPYIQDQIRQRLSVNRRTLLGQAAQGAGFEPLSSDGGWSAVLRLSGVEDGEAFVSTLLQEKQTLIHPGYLFDFEEEDLFMVSLLTPPALFQEGVARLRSAVQ